MFYQEESVYRRGDRFPGGTANRPMPDSMRHEDPGYSAVRALEPLTGDLKWEYRTEGGGVTEAGVMTTAGDVLFSGTRKGHFFALDATDGKLLWRQNLGGLMASNPMSYQAAGKQMVTIACGNSIFTFGLPDEE